MRPNGRNTECCEICRVLDRKQKQRKGTEMQTRKQFNTVNAVNKFKNVKTVPSYNWWITPPSLNTLNISDVPEKNDTDELLREATERKLSWYRNATIVEIIFSRLFRKIGYMPVITVKKFRRKSY